MFTGVGEADARVRRWIRSVRVDLAHDLRRDRVQFGQRRCSNSVMLPVLPASWWYVGAVKLLFCALSLAIPAGMVGKTVVGGVRDRPSNRISAEVLPGRKKGTSEEFVAARASPDAVVFTDDLASYNRVPNRFRVNHSTGEYVDGMVQVNGEESFWALLKRGYYGTRPRVGDGLWREHGCEPLLGGLTGLAVVALATLDGPTS